ncbi:MAG: hypothetical protein ABR577_08890 [Pyrinomonadaceae bacterium]
MQLLTWLTVIYLAVLVLALAASLITIFVYLWRIGSALAEIRGALDQAKEHTAPLEGHIETVNRGLANVRDELKAGDEHLAAIDESLNVVAEHLGIGVAAGFGAQIMKAVKRIINP